MAILYTKWRPYTFVCIPNGHRIYQPFQLQGPSKLAQIEIFGLKMYHLAILMERIVRIALAYIHSLSHERTFNGWNLVFQIIRSTMLLFEACRAFWIGTTRKGICSLAEQSLQAVNCTKSTTL
jgi:hypothetical protein